jgi:serine/threonine protein kinase
MNIDPHQLLRQKLGNCELERLLGQGGMGAVYLAQQARPRRTVAVKVLLPELLSKSGGAGAVYTEFLARFRREADAIAALDHVNIIPIYEYGEQEQVAYLVMPYVTGGTLRDLLAKRGLLPLNEAIPIIEQAAAALDYAHSHGIIHRDLKPGNMLFHADGRLLLTDFGIAKMVNETSSPDQTSLHTLTTTGTIIGTPEYLSPEQATASPIDRRSDVYSLGIVVFQMLSRHVPFTGPTAVSIALKHAMEEPPSLTQLNPTISARVEQVVRKAIAKRPEERYATAGNFARALAAVSRAHSSGFFSDKTVQGEDMVPVVLMSEKKVAEVPFVLEDEAAPINITHTPHFQEELEARPTVHMPRSPRRRRNRLVAGMILLSGILALLLILGSSAISLHWLPGQSHPSTEGTEQQQAGTSTTRAATNSSAVLPRPSVPVGKLLYGVSLPACTPQQRSLWSPTSNMQVTCTPSAMKLANTSGGTIGGVFLNSLPRGAPIPDNYVLEVQVKESPSSQGAFGMFFRVQTGTAHKGAFSYLMDASGHWTGNIYNDTTGQASQLYGRQSRALNASGFTTIDIVVQGSTFSLYFDGVEQGGIESAYYPGGILGLVAEPGTEVLFKNMAIYALPGNV